MLSCEVMTNSAAASVVPVRRIGVAAVSGLLAGILLATRLEGFPDPMLFLVHCMFIGTGFAMLASLGAALSADFTLGAQRPGFVPRAETSSIRA